MRRLSRAPNSTIWYEREKDPKIIDYKSWKFLVNRGLGDRSETMSDQDRKASVLQIVQREEENNAMGASSEADEAAAGGDYHNANVAADGSEQHAQNAVNIGGALGDDE
ncbi:hypothetical protein J1614_005319 [Plenodomus biglobosus]|nr:hypothetical protein J1614_005319 [Plenodomus biglobosus]